MKTATLVLDKDFSLAQIDPRVYGGFAEHLGRHIYTGIYEPGHATADTHGFRGDVIDLVKELSMPIMRYPGGNFVSGYNWEDGVGPRETRPRKLDLAWGATETNQFGTNEFIDWCQKIKTEPMMAVNLGTRGMDDARNFVEYCNHPGGTYYSDLRKSHGYATPHKIKTWCLGNEMDGPWQIGARTAFEYGRVANETAKIMKWIDGSIETILCGSSARSMPTFGTWEWEALNQSYENIDYVSLHTYYGNRDGDTLGFLAEPENMGSFIDETAALCDAVKATKKSKKTVQLSFDEWNVWFHSNGAEAQSQRWDDLRPLLEDIYTMEDALVVGGMLLQLINHADRVKIACIAQVVNVIAPIMTRPGGGAWRQTIFYPLMHCSNLGRGTALRCAVNSPTYDAKTREKTPYLAASAVVSESGDELTVFAINRSLDEPMALTVDLRAFGKATLIDATTLSHSDLKAVNTEANPDNVAPKALTGVSVPNERLTATLAPASWNVIRLKI
jgi:alpha-L-arabinofuranosidase